MENLISGIYGFLADVLAFVAGIPSGITSGGPGLLFSMTAVLAILAMILLFLAVIENGRGYDFYVKLMVGGVLLFITSHYAVLDLNRMNVIKTVPLYGTVIPGLFLAGATAFAVVNFLLNKKSGKITIFLWAAEFLFAASAIRLWGYIQGSGQKPGYEKIMLVSDVLKPLTETLNKLGFRAITGIFEFVILMILMFITIFYLFKAKQYVPKEWKGCVVSQVLIGLAYLIFESHRGIAWRVDQAFITFLLFCTGGMLYLFLFCYQIWVHEQRGCIGAFFIGVVGVLWDCTIVLAVDMAKRGAMGKTLDRLSNSMTWIYRKVTIGIHTDFTMGNPVMAVIGAIIAIVIAVILLLLLFLLWNKVFDFDEEGAGMGVAWFRNCAMVLILPIIVCWVCSMYGNIFGESQRWVMVLVQTLACIGAALCFSNIAPAFKGDFTAQLKLIFVPTIVSMAVICVLVPVLLALI
ncbi:MAG: hypothetical protein Q4F21_08455 [Lachnospiraceae bacterium]|nr:hypothetical protein [Lachnospiraceae bacterium]